MSKNIYKKQNRICI